MRAQSFLLLCLLLALCGRDAVAQSQDEPRQDEPPNSANSALYLIDNMPLAIAANEKAYIHGISTGLVSANAFLSVQKQPLIFCQPPKLAITEDQMTDILRRAIKDDPSLGKKSLGYAVIESLRYAFPCKK